MLMLSAMGELGSGAAVPDAVKRVLRELRPVAVLLHGSRAVGSARSDSDWDLCVLVADAREPRWLTQRVDDAWVDLDIVPATARDSVITDVLGTSLRSAQVVVDSADRVGAALVSRARELQEEGRHVRTSTLREQAAHAQRVAQRMAATTRESELFFFHLSTFFGLAVRYWFDREGRWPEPPHEALESIGTADPEYAALLSELADDATAGAKAQAVESIVGRLLVDA